MRASTLFSLAAATTLLIVVAPSADATVYTYYSENFNSNNGDGVRGPVPPNSPMYSNSSFNVDASGAVLRDAGDFAFVNGTSFQFRDLASVSNGPPATGTAFLMSKTVSFFVGTGPFSYLNASLRAFISSPLSAGESFLVKAIVNGSETSDTMNVTSSGIYTLNIKDNVTAGLNTFAFEIVATQTTNSTWGVDNLLAQGAASPEPASLSLLGMGVLAMCGAGYRRRRKAFVAEV